MNMAGYISSSEKYMNILCREFPGRSVGSENNKLAAAFFEKEISSFGWKTGRQTFDALDWIDGPASLEAGGRNFHIHPGPYSGGCNVRGELISVCSVADLEGLDASGKIILLHGEIAKEQLMPKNFVFYNPEEHKKIIFLLEQSRAAALITATGRNSSLAGGAYPFPLIEDGDFDIPSVFMTDEEGLKLLPYTGEKVLLKSDCRRTPSNGWNVTAYKGSNPSERIIVTAHIDTKKGTPGAIDNSSGIAVLLLLAEMLKDYTGPRQIEIVALNGEDYYAVSGQMKFIGENMNCFSQIRLNINIDGAGYKDGKSAYSLYNLPEKMHEKAEMVFGGFSDICEGPQWPQGDHSIFVQSGVPAIAITSKWFTDNMDIQDITHTEKDRLEIVDCRKLAAIAEAIAKFILSE